MLSAIGNFGNSVMGWGLPTSSGKSPTIPMIGAAMPSTSGGGSNLLSKIWGGVKDFASPGADSFGRPTMSNLGNVMGLVGQGIGIYGGIKGLSHDKHMSKMLRRDTNRQVTENQYDFDAKRDPEAHLSPFNMQMAQAQLAQQQRLGSLGGGGGGGVVPQADPRAANLAQAQANYNAAFR